MQCGATQPPTPTLSCLPLLHWELQGRSIHDLMHSTARTTVRESKTEPFMQLLTAPLSRSFKIKLFCNLR